MTAAWGAGRDIWGWGMEMTAEWGAGRDIWGWGMEITAEWGAGRDIWGWGMELTAEWRKLQSSEVLDLHCSQDTVRVNDSRKIRLAEHVARMGDDKCV